MNRHSERALRIMSGLAGKLPTPLTTLPLLAVLDLARVAHLINPPSELNGRTFRMHLVDLGIKQQFRCVGQRFILSQDDAAELILRASLKDFLAMAAGKADADTLFFQRRLVIEGDTDLGLIVKNWLDSIERPDWIRRLPFSNI